MHFKILNYLIFRREDKLYLMDHIDDIISAELPDPNDPKMQKLFNIVSKQMIHGPCGHYNPKCVCMIEGKCSKEFPKPFVKENNSNVDGYPRYKRRNNGQYFIKEIFIVDQCQQKIKIELKVCLFPCFLI